MLLSITDISDLSFYADFIIQ